MPKQGIGGWAGGCERDGRDRRLRIARGGREKTAGESRCRMECRWRLQAKARRRTWPSFRSGDNYRAKSACRSPGAHDMFSLLMAGSTNPMPEPDRQWRGCRRLRGRFRRSGSRWRILETWWPIEQDYFIDDFQFRLDAPLPTRVDLKTGNVRMLDAATFKGRGGKIPGGAATVLRSGRSTGEGIEIAHRARARQRCGHRADGGDAGEVKSSAGFQPAIILTAGWKPALLPACPLVPNASPAKHGARHWRRLGHWAGDR